MKIIHTSDLHLSSPLTSKLPADKSRERRGELLANFSRLISEAERYSAEAIIIAGDLFDSTKIPERAIDTVYDAVRNAKDIKFLYLAGNHDEDAVKSTSLASLPNFIILDGENRAVRFKTGVTVTGITRGGKGAFDSLSLDPTEKNIVVMHGELRDSASTQEQIAIGEAAGRNIDYLALGHYHSYSEARIDNRGVAVYSGTPEGRGFDEAGECGFVVIDTDGTSLKHRFVAFASRKLHIVPIKLDGITRTAEIISGAERALSQISRRDLVRLNLVGEFSPELWRDTDAITRTFKDRFYYFEVKDSSRIHLDPAEYRNDKSLKGEFIRIVLSDDSIDEQTKSKIISCGIEALMGE